MDNQRYFYISGFISLSLFMLFLGLFLVMLFQVEDIKKYGFKKENYVSVSVVLTPSRKQQKHKSSSVSKVVSQVVTKSKNIDVNNLFSDVWTEKIEHKKIKRKVNSKRINEIQKQLKLKENNKVKPVNETIKKLQQAEEKTNEDASSAANEVNEYLAKIQTIVYQHFNVPPNTEGNSVKTVIELDPFGKMIDFRILNYSSSEALNSEVDKIKKRLTNVVFPQNPQHKSSKTIVILISKE
jgi:protein TonB